MFGLIGAGSLIKIAIAVFGAVGLLFYGIYVEKQNANKRAVKVVVEQLTKRNYESNKVADRKEDIKRQAADAIETIQNDATDADICISANVLLKINSIR